MREGVGGANGLAEGVMVAEYGAWVEGVKGSILLRGNLLASLTSESGVMNSTDWMKTTWQFSGYICVSIMAC